MIKSLRDKVSLFKSSTTSERLEVDDLCPLEVAEILTKMDSKKVLLKKHEK